MSKLVMASMLFSTLLFSPAYGQYIDDIKKPDKPHLKNSDKIKPDVRDEFPVEDALSLKNIDELKDNFHSQKIFNNNSIPVKPSFNIVSSFQSNIKFGGFWQNYVILNFTPDLYIRPFSFISVYASHNISKYIPLTSIGENIGSLAAEGAAVIAVDNCFKFLFPRENIYCAIAGFAVKTLLMNLIKNPGNGNKILEFKYYYYSVSVRL